MLELFHVPTYWLWFSEAICQFSKNNWHHCLSFRASKLKLATMTRVLSSYRFAIRGLGYVRKKSKTLKTFRILFCQKNEQNKKSSQNIFFTIFSWRRLNISGGKKTLFSRTVLLLLLTDVSVENLLPWLLTHMQTFPSSWNWNLEREFLL